LIKCRRGGGNWSASGETGFVQEEEALKGGARMNIGRSTEGSVTKHQQKRKTNKKIKYDLKKTATYLHLQARAQDKMIRKR